jgi:hypothetical protein
MCTYYNSLRKFSLLGTIAVLIILTSHKGGSHSIEKDIADFEMTTL